MQKKFIAGAVVAAMLLPVLASAQTSVSAQMESLLSQIQALQTQLKNLMASSSVGSLMRGDDDKLPPGQVSKARCLMLARTLRVGMQGDDVRALQEWLSEDKENGFSAKATGFFGPMTARAMAKFQMRMGIASSSDGTAGPLTRGYFERTCGKGLGKTDDDDVTRGKIRGEITAAAASTITVRSGDASHLVNITGSTTIKVYSAATSTPTVGSMADLTVGKDVAVAGILNADKSITAHEIKVGIKPPPPPKPIKLRFDHRGKKMMNDKDD